MKDTYRIFVINTGSTSTKVAVYDNENEVCSRTVDHTSEERGRFEDARDEYEMRSMAVDAFVKESGIDPKSFDVIASRGGTFFRVRKAGAYEVDDRVMDLVRNPRPGFRPTGSWVASLIANRYATQFGIKAYIYDPVFTDEMQDIARYSGVSWVRRTGGGHPLNTREVARRAASELGKDYKESTILVCHLGGGISLELHSNGRIIDQAGGAEGSFTPERVGRVPFDRVIQACFSDKYDRKYLTRLSYGGGGLVDYLGTNDCREVERRIATGDKEAENAYQAMAYQLSKDIASLAAVVHGMMDAIALTGGIAHSKMMTGWIADRVSWIAPILKFPGTFEMEALAHGILRVVRGEEDVNDLVELPRQ